MSVWFRTPDLDAIHRLGEHTLDRNLGIVFTAFDDESLTATMPVDERTKQPFGLLHGGANVALAESLGSVAANYAVDPDKHICVGLDINANHLRAVRDGIVTGTTRALHVGRTTHVWQIHIHDERDRLCSVARITMQVLEHPAN